MGPPGTRGGRGGTVTIRCFAQARVALGRARLDWPMGGSERDLGDILEGLAAAHPPLGPLLPRCRFAINGEMVEGRTGRLRPGDDLAIHPPYSGG